MFSDTPSEEDQDQSTQAQQVEEEEKSTSPLVELCVTLDPYLGWLPQSILLLFSPTEYGRNMFSC